MRTSGFRQQSIEEVKAKQEAKRALRAATIDSKPLKGKKASKSKVKVKTQAQLKKDLDTIFSIYIRQKHEDNKGNVECYTCRKLFTVKTIQNGHFVSRQYLATRWSDDNCRPQCWGCNGFGKGKPLDFEERLKKDLGEEYVEKMKASRHISLKLDRHWYTAEIDKYKLLIT
jgi:hypothetical protein